MSARVLLFRLSCRFVLALMVCECQTSPAQCTAVGYAHGKAGRRGRFGTAGSVRLWGAAGSVRVEGAAGSELLVRYSYGGAAGSVRLEGARAGSRVGRCARR
ncbi:hypothetical protein TPA0906_51460 [Streptomyces olivaceus]|nr:hypothetical protein TPA0906_51460 [Streptomyces olivaceus]